MLSRHLHVSLNRVAGMLLGRGPAARDFSIEVSHWSHKLFLEPAREAALVHDNWVYIERGNMIYATRIRRWYMFCLYPLW